MIGNPLLDGGMEEWGYGMPYDRITQAAIDTVIGKGFGMKLLRDAIEAKHPGAVARARKRLDEERFDRKFKGNPPPWVRRYVAKYTPGLGEIRWHRSRVGSFHGQCAQYWSPEISVTVPYNLPPEREDEAKVLVLHELAHSRALHDQHGDDFYEEWVRLLKGEGLYRAALTQYGGRSGSRRGGSLRSAARRLTEKDRRQANRAALGVAATK